MQIIIAFNLLLALSALHLQSPGTATDMVTNGCCVALAMIMSLILAQTLIFVSQIRFAADATVALSQNAETDRKTANGIPQEYLQMAVWTLFSLVATFLFRWTVIADEFARQLETSQLFLLPQLFILAPHLLCLLLMWSLGDYSARSSTSKWWERFKGVAARVNARTQMILLPVILPIVAVYLVRTLLDSQSAWQNLPAATQTIGLSFAAMFLLLLTYPFLLSRLWHTESLAAKNPDDHHNLKVLSQTLRLRISGIERWNTRYRIANAAVVGWIPGIRKILVSDVLTRILTPTELRAVFLHEAGHIRHSHTLWRLSTVLLPLQLMLIGLTTRDVELGPEFLQSQPWLVATILGLFIASAGLLSWFSKELELEADRYAWKQLRETSDSQTAESVLEANPLVSAMLKTVRVTESSIHQKSLMHPTTANRIRQICRLSENPTAAKQIDQRLQNAKRCLIFFFVTATLGVGLTAFL